MSDRTQIRMYAVASLVGALLAGPAVQAAGKAPPPEVPTCDKRIGTLAVAEP